MRVVLDTNILLSALITRGTPPDQLYEAWRHGRFDLASAEQQLAELNRFSRRPFFLARLKPSEIGRMINDIRRLAVMCDPLPSVSAGRGMLPRSYVFGRGLKPVLKPDGACCLSLDHILLEK